MKKLYNDSSAISEIVGALMLVLIVVIAASAFAVFISQQQKIQQDNQLIKDQKAGEIVLISSLTTQIDKTNGVIKNINVTISNAHQGNSLIDQISFNNYVLQNCSMLWYNESTNKYETTSLLNLSSKLLLVSQKSVFLSVNVSDPSEFLQRVSFSSDQSIQVSLFTSYLNDFSKAFFAPTPIIKIDIESQWNSSANNYTPFLILDGSQSDQPGDSTILNWNWTIEHPGETNITEFGRKIRFDPMAPSLPYNITLKVTNSNGLIGIARTIFYN
jgi:flagellin-like protein